MQSNKTASPAPVPDLNQGKDRSTGKLSPRSFMRGRRPHLFSDTHLTPQSVLDRSVLDHHLSTLTSRKEEFVFEHFARRLAEKEICPNLIPQTGPTGGGDSKVDTETYSVAEEISSCWFEGEQSAGQQRWAFAFSTKREWKPKVKEDVRKLAGTGRGYTRAFFITSQYVPDRDRGALQDGLQKEHCLPVEILDRTWILERVFKNGREQLAIDALGLASKIQIFTAKGPIDSARQVELEELERDIADSNRYAGTPFALVEDCLQAARLARGLELPRVEVDGRFERASRIARTRGLKFQQLRVAYEKAWTDYWWHEDFESFVNEYEIAEALALETSGISELELLCNLWQVLSAAAQLQYVGSATARLDERTGLLKKQLRSIEKDRQRPAAALL